MAAAKPRIDASPQLISSIRQRIICWYKKHGRLYPWRTTKDPFKVLVAEMMLRRTKADQVKPVFLAFFKTFPHLQLLAKAKKSRIEKILYPLGLHWRAPSFRQVARVLIRRHDCRVPDSRNLLIELPGVGDYVAGAVLSIAFGKKEWIVDSNIVRLYRRYFGITTSKDGRRDKSVIAISKSYCNARDPRTANLAILDLSALICTPSNPACHRCPIRRDCTYALALVQLNGRQPKGS